MGLWALLSARLSIDLIFWSGLKQPTYLNMLDLFVQSVTCLAARRVSRISGDGQKKGLVVCVAKNSNASESQHIN